MAGRPNLANEWTGRPVLGTLIVCAGYYLGGIVGIRLIFPSSGIAVLWPPTAILLAGLLLSPVRTWWIYLLAVFPTHLHLTATFQPGVPLLTMLSQAVSNVVQAAAGAGAMRYVIGPAPQLDNLRSMTAFIVLAAIAAPGLAAAVAAYLFILTGWAADFWSTWRVRFLANPFAVLSITPLIVQAHADWFRPIREAPVRRYAEFFLVQIGLLLVCIAVFGQEAAAPSGDAALLYAPLPLLLWAAVRFGLSGLCTSLLVVAFLSLSSAIAGRGPFVIQSPVENSRSLQIFLMTVSVPLMLLSVLVEERRRIAEALRDSQARYALATAAGGAGVWDWNLETNEIYLDPVLKAALGFADHEIKNHLDDWGRRMHPEDADLMLARARDCIKGATLHYEVERRMLHKDGSTRWFLARGSVVGVTGTPVRIIGTDTDITERKKAQQALEQAQTELARMSRVSTLGEFAAAVAHEVSQPLSAILMNTRTCLRWLSAPSPDLPEVREALREVVESGQRASEVIAHTRALFKDKPVESARLDVNAVIGEVCELAHGRLQAAQVWLRTDLADGLPPARGDRVQLEQVLLNLIVNGIDAMRDVRSRVLAISSGIDGAGFIQVSVRDSGAGLDAADLERIFRAFYTTKPDGMGMGLAISASIIRAHGGRIWAVSNDAGGATFCFTVPTEPVVGAGAAPRAQNADAAVH